MTVPRIAAQMVAEGATKVVIVGDDPDRHRGDPLIPRSVAFYPRAELDAVQRMMREVPGCSVLIYDQQCATEKRRQRKRDLAPKATKRAVINPRVCEDCGDCSRASNCIAIEPIETEWGRKRRIDQSGCNQDFSCVEGFCPSFLTLEGAEPVKPPTPVIATEAPLPVLPEAAPGEAWNILLAGVGGQGVTALAISCSSWRRIWKAGRSAHSTISASRRRAVAFTRSSASAAWVSRWPIRASARARRMR